MLQNVWNSGLTFPSWRDSKPEDLSKDSVLSLLSFRLKHGTDLHDVLGGPGKRWRAAIDYVYTIPGCKSFEWGESLNDHDQIQVFIQWESAQSWLRFEKSFGIGLILPYVETPFTDLRLKSPTTTGEFGGAGKIVDQFVISFEPEILPKASATFKSYFKILVENLEGRVPDSLTSGWLEKDVTNYFQPMPGQISAAQRHPVFIAILVWQKDTYTRDVSDYLENYLKSRGPPGIELFVSRTSTDLNQELPGEAPVNRSSRPLATDLASLLEGYPPRSYHEDHGQGNLYHGCSDTTDYRDIRYGKRRLPSPMGYFIPQGELCRGWDRFFSLKKHSSPPQYDMEEVCEIVWLRFRPFIFWGHPIHDHPPTVISQLLSRLKQWEGLQEVLWGRDVEDADAAAIILIWRNPRQRTANFQKLVSDLDEWAGTGFKRNLTEAPKYQAFPKLGPSGFRLHVYNYMEFSSIFVPTNEPDEDLLEHTLEEFSRTYSVNTGYHFVRAGRYEFGSWALEGMPRTETTSTLREYVVVTAWETPEGRKGWYEDFTRISDSYERLGHQLDALKMFITGSARSRFLAVQLVL